MKQSFTAGIKLTIGIVVVLVLGGGAWWYISSNAQPALGSYSVTRINVVEAIDEPGTVVAENKAGLSFQEAGQIAHVYTKEGSAVNTGAVLADLDSASFEASVEEANAALAAAEAKLEALQTGATSQTIAVSQTALASAEQALTNGRSGIPNALNDAYEKANDAVRAQLLSFFLNPEQNNPQLTFSVSDSQVLNSVQSLRLSASAELNAWQGELASTTVNSSDSDLEAALQDASDHLSLIKNFMNDTMLALNDEIGLSAITSASYKTSATTGLNEVNAAVTEIKRYPAVARFRKYCGCASAGGS